MREERLRLVFEELARRLSKQLRLLRLLILLALEHRHTDSRVLNSIQKIREQVVEKTAEACRGISCVNHQGLREQKRLFQSGNCCPPGRIF